MIEKVFFLMWEPREGRKQERKEGSEEGRGERKEGGQLTNEVNERPVLAISGLGGYYLPFIRKYPFSAADH